MSGKFDAVFMIGYGAPEGREDVVPFLRRVAGPRPIPEERLREVASHYEMFDGKSPLNEFTRSQAAKLEKFLARKGRDLPVYVGMRNWRPFIRDELERMRGDGVSGAVGLIMAIYRCDASWERYMRDVAEARADLGMELRIEYVPPLFDHPLFVKTSAERVRESMRRVPARNLDTTMLVFTAHSIPRKMSDSSPYVSQFETSARLVARSAGCEKWTTAYQSASVSAGERWLGPDIRDVVRKLASEGFTDVVVQPIGFLCDHIEVLFDIGVEASEVAGEAGIRLYRAETVNDSDGYVEALGDCVLGILNSRGSGR